MLVDAILIVLKPLLSQLSSKLFSGKATKRKRKEEKLMKEYKQHQGENAASLSTDSKTKSDKNSSGLSNLFLHRSLRYTILRFNRPGTC